MPISPIPPSDEPADFRRQAGEYARYRRGYSDHLYDAVTAHTGPGAGRLALDLACGTGLVLRDLAVRGWRTLGVDLSAPMLAEVEDRGVGLVRARAEALPLRADLAALVTCGMGFHWMPAQSALAELARVVRPGGWVALFWRYPLVDQIPGRLVREVLGELGHPVPDGAFYVHGEAPFAGSPFEPLPPRRLEVPLRFTPREYRGLVGTIEVIRRYAGADHARVLARIGDALARELPATFEEVNEEFLFLGRLPGEA
jgi:SAM-dependent methyltransferase